MTFASCDMVYHARKDDGEWDRFFDYPVGHFYWAVDEVTGERYLWMKLPKLDGDPKGSACCIPVQPTPEKPSWGWNGNLEKPTLTPSVFHDPNNPQSPHHWHGWIRESRMVGC